MVEASDFEIKKALVGLAIEKSLLEFSDTVLEVVSERLQDDFKIFIPDSYEHPEYLNHVLKDLFGGASVIITNSIQKHLDDFSDNKSIKEFLIQIKK